MARTFGTRLRRAREAAGLSQSDLARGYSKEGCNRSHIHHLEGQSGAPKFDTTVALARAIGIDPSELDPRLAPATKR